MKCWLTKIKSNCMMISGWPRDKRPPGHRRHGRIRTINRQGRSKGEDQLQGRVEVMNMARKGDIIALKGMKRLVESSERIMGRLMAHTKVERGIRQASTTGHEVKRRVATSERRNKSNSRKQEVANSIRTRIQMPRGSDLASMGSLEKNGLIYLVLLLGVVS